MEFKEANTIDNHQDSKEYKRKEVDDPISNDVTNVDCLVTSTMIQPPFTPAQIQEEVPLGSKTRPIVIEEEDISDPLEDQPKDSENLYLEQNLILEEEPFEEEEEEEDQIGEPITTDQNLSPYPSAHSMHIGSSILQRVSRLRVHIPGRTNSELSKRKGTDMADDAASNELKRDKKT